MNRLLQLLNGRRVAIVGNAPERVDRSEDIDSADVVLRFNDFYNMPAGNVGHKVDVVLQTVTSEWLRRSRSGRTKMQLDAIHSQHPAVFLAKMPGNFPSEARKIYGPDVRIDDLSHLFQPWWRFTTGGAVLCYLSKYLVNAEVQVYGFARGQEGDWEEYIEKSAKHFAHVAKEERRECLSAIETLERLTITSPGTGQIPRCIVVPVKAESEGAPGKNRALLRPCLEKLQGLSLPIYVAGDDYGLLEEVKDLCIPVPLRKIGATDDVTKTLCRWRVSTGFTGDVALVQCTSPRMRPDWVMQCLDALSRASVSATAVDVSFKPTAMFMEEYGVFVPCSTSLPPASVARQLLPRCIRITGAVVSFHTDALVHDSFFRHGSMSPVMIDEADALDVDTQQQFSEAISYLENKS